MFVTLVVLMVACVYTHVRTHPVICFKYVVLAVILHQEIWSENEYLGTHSLFYSSPPLPTGTGSVRSWKVNVQFYSRKQKNRCFSLTLLLYSITQIMDWMSFYVNIVIILKTLFQWHISVEASFSQSLGAWLLLWSLPWSQKKKSPSVTPQRSLLKCAAGII